MAEGVTLEVLEVEREVGGGKRGEACRRREHRVQVHATVFRASKRPGGKRQKEEVTSPELCQDPAFNVLTDQANTNISASMRGTVRSMA